MYRVKEIISSLDYDELLKLKKDLDDGGFHLKALIKEKLKEHEKQHAKVCSNCMSEMDPYSTNNYTVLFGPEDFKKKASFCGPDCMQYFMDQLQRIKKGETEDRK